MRTFPKIGSSLAIAIAILVAGLAGPTQAVVKPNSIPAAESFTSGVVGSPESLGYVETDASRAARAQLASHAVQWGINPAQFELVRSVAGLSGMTTVRFSQRISGLEVVGSLVALTVSASGDLLSYTIATSNYNGPLSADQNEAAAEQSTKRALASATGVDPSQVAIEQTKLVIVDSALSPVISSGQRLLWRSTTSISGNIETLATTYIDATTGDLVSTLPLVRGISANPNVCEMQVGPGLAPVTGVVPLSNSKFGVNINTGGLSLPLCGMNTPGLNAPETQIGIVNITKTWNYYNSFLGLDINDEKYLGNISPTVNGDVIPRISAFVDVCTTGSARGEQCPYGNAFWVPWASPDCNSTVCSGIFMGANFDHADDVIAHELSHGVTYSLAFNAGLADNSETAALSEAISDIFGEAVDQLNVDPNEAPDPNWMLGEDFQAGGFRNMRAPNVLKIDKTWHPADSHENSGPVNRLAWLLANGGKVGKTKIKAIGTTPATPGLCLTPAECTGITNVSALTLAAVSNVTSSASYIDFAKAFQSACDVNVLNKTPGFSKKTCANVGAALKAQGFTKYSVTGITKLHKVIKDADTIVEANLISSTGAPFAGQTASLQYKNGSKWKTIASGTTDGAGKISFTANWSKSVTYRIASKSNSGVFEANSKATKVTVR